MKKFRVHGDLALTIDGPVLISRIRGPFNSEFARNYMRTVTPIIHTLAAAGPWVGITEISESALFPLEMSEIMRKQTTIAATQLKMAANSWVIAPSVEGYGIVDKQARKVFAGVLPFEIFETSDEARVWVLRQLGMKIQTG